MSPYANLASTIGTTESFSLCARLASWHDAMVGHERRLRAGRADACDDECPHVEARTLWKEAVATFGTRADALTFLRSRAVAATRPEEPGRAPADALAEAADTARGPGRAGSRTIGPRPAPPARSSARSHTTPAEW